MQFSIAIAALAGVAAAAPHLHSRLHEKRGILADVKAAVENTAAAFIGEQTSGNHVVNTFMNKANDDVTLVIWGPQGSWINNVAPFVTQTIKAGENLTVSHAIGSGTPNTGGWSAIYPDTQLVNGQISNLWGEFSFVNDMYSSSTYDVSMEVNMDGHGMTIEGPKCTSSSESNQCVFKCKSGTTCGEDDTYELVGCTAGSQEGATSGLWGNQASGGCQGISNEGITQLYTTLH